MEMRAEVILKATKVDGIYSADPMIDKSAQRYTSISYLQVLERGLKVMDATAISLCMDNKLPIVVFNLRQGGNIRRVVIQHEGRTVAEFPLTVGVVGVVLAPMLAAVAAIAAIIQECTVEVERTDAPADKKGAA
jgi:aspartokinase